MSMLVGGGNAGSQMPQMGYQLVQLFRKPVWSHVTQFGVNTPFDHAMSFLYFIQINWLGTVYGEGCSRQPCL